MIIKSLQDLKNYFEKNNASILQRWGEVKHMLRNYEGSLGNFAMADVIMPNDVMTL